MNPIIFLWAHPRSMSTALERIMRERGDLNCLHAPFLHYYYQHRTNKPLPHFERRVDHPDSYEETRDYILARYLQHHLPYYRKLRDLSLTGSRDEH